MSSGTWPESSRRDGLLRVDLLARRLESSGRATGTSRSPVANASISGVGGTSPCASTSWLPTSGYQGALQPCGAERPLRRGERAGVGGRVVVGAVVEGVGGVGRLHAVVARRAAVGVDRRRPFSVASARSSSLRCALSVMSPVTNTACGCSRLSARTAASSVCVENASWGRKVDVNGGPIRSRNGTRAGDSSSRTWVSVSWAKVASVRPGFARRRRGRRSGSPGPGLEEPVAVGVDERGAASVEPGAGRGRRASPPHAGEREQRDERARRASLLPQPRDDRLAQDAARDERGGDHREREQAAGDERDLAERRRERERRRSPRRGGRRAGRRRRPRARRPAIAAGTATATAAPASTSADGRARRRRTRAAGRPRRAARARSPVSAWTSA